MFGIMINNLHGGPIFVDKNIPATKMTANYMHNTVDLSVRRIEKAGGFVEAIICDGNRINQAFFKKFHTVPEKPCLTSDGKFLLFDFVHLLKNVRNLWLTKKTGQLEFTHNGQRLHLNCTEKIMARM